MGQTVVQPFDLTLDSVAEKMEVVEQGEMLQASATSGSLAMGYERVEHGTSQGRGYLNFVLTAPGIVPAAGSSTGRSPASTWNLANDSGFSAAGMRSRNNSITIDGSDNRDETTGAARVAVPVEMIQELRVAGQTVSADFGGAAAAIYTTAAAVRSNATGPYTQNANWRANVLSQTYFNTSTFVAPPQLTFGTLGRAVATGPAAIIGDLSVLKDFSMPWENHKLQFRWESLNFLNHANFGNPTTGRGNPNFGRILGLTAGNQARINQLGLHYRF